MTTTNALASPAPELDQPGAQASDVPIFHVRPSVGWVGIDFRELWKYRELVYFMVWRDIKVRYKQAALGAAWAIIQPLMTMILFSIVFGRLGGISSGGVPYPLFAFAGLVLWMFYSNGMIQSANSLVASANVITKVYFPRLVVPIASVLSGIIDFSLGFVMLLGMLAWYRVVPGWTMLWAPAFVLIAVVAALGVGFWLSAMNVQFRDVRHAVPFIAQFWMFASPVVFPSSLLHEPWRTLFGINPMAGAIEGFRWALFAKEPPPTLEIAISAVAALALLVSGAYYFRRMERTFGETV